METETNQKKIKESSGSTDQINIEKLMHKVHTNIAEKKSSGVYPKNLPEILKKPLTSQNTKELAFNIEQMEKRANIKADYFLPSTRPIAGPFINIIKKTIGKILYPYNKDFVKQINAFNNYALRAIADLKGLNNSLNYVPLWSENYERFEDNFRGSSEDIKGSLIRYLPYYQNQNNVLDVGCGRGEFLEILKNNNVQSYGIDISHVMIDRCLNKGLSVKKEGVIDHLEDLKQDSLGGIFSSQVVEHLKPDEVLKLIELSHQKLKPGAHIVIETLNPQCITVLNNNFTIDLSHKQIIHPQTLYFLIKIIGFEDVEVRYCDEYSKEDKLKTIAIDKNISKNEQANFDTLNKNIERLNNLLFGYQSYAVVGKKALKDA